MVGECAWKAIGFQGVQCTAPSTWQRRDRDPQSGDGAKGLFNFEKGMGCETLCSAKLSEKGSMSWEQAQLLSGTSKRKGRAQPGNLGMKGGSYHPRGISGEEEPHHLTVDQGGRKGVNW